MAADLPGELISFERDNDQNLLAATYYSGDGKIRLYMVLIQMISPSMTL
jgi:hypothetical protein